MTENKNIISFPKKAQAEPVTGKPHRNARRGVALPSDISPEIKKLACDLFGFLNNTDAGDKVKALVLVLARELADMPDDASRAKIIEDVGEIVGVPLSDLVGANEVGAETLEDDTGEVPE